MLKDTKVIVDEESGEEKMLNDNFIQFYSKNILLIAEMNKSNSTAVNILLWIIRHMDRKNALVVSQQAISEAMSLHRVTVAKAVKFLQEKKAIAVFKSGNTNIYAVNRHIAWKSQADKKQYALFEANVYIAESEQEIKEYQTPLFGHVEPKRARKRKDVKTNTDLKDSA